MRTVAILPVKRFDRAKQRLSSALGPQGRVTLAEAMLRDVMVGLARVEGLERTVVVTGEPRAKVIAAFFGAELIEDEREAGQSAAAALGIERAEAAGAERALLVAGDCPALDPAEVGALLARHTASPAAVIVPDRHGSGTNALLLAPPAAIAPAFGPGSCDRHVERSRQAGIEPVVEPVGSLAYDVDTADDLAALRAELERRGGVTLATVAALESLEQGGAAVGAP